MKREEQRNIAAEEYTKKWYKEGLDIEAEDYPTDARITIADFTKGAEWADAHPYWHKAGEELPEKSDSDSNISIRVVITGLDEGWYCNFAVYDYSTGDWLLVDEYGEILDPIDCVDYWMPLPNKSE